MDKVYIGNVALGKLPRVIAIVDECLSREQIVAIQRKGVSMLEIRVDLFNETIDQVCAFLGELKSAIAIPCIGTVRETPENQADRYDIFRKILPYIDAVDIEIDTSIHKNVIDLAAGKVIIVSYHNYINTPDNDELSRIVTQAVSLGANVVKIATMAQEKNDVVRLMNFTHAQSQHCITIAMGQIGKISRIVAPLFGSCATYAFLNKTVAPGQLSVDEMVTELQQFYPDFSNQ